jgi:hypothetical protein
MRSLFDIISYLETFIQYLRKQNFRLFTVDNDVVKVLSKFTGGKQKQWIIISKLLILPLVFK